MNSETDIISAGTVDDEADNEEDDDTEVVIAFTDSSAATGTDRSDIEHSLPPIHDNTGEKISNFCRNVTKRVRFDKYMI